MPSPASGKKAEMIIPREVRETGRDQYHTVSYYSRRNLRTGASELTAWRHGLTGLENKLLVIKI